MDAFKARLDVALGNPDYWLTIMARFNTSYSMIL